MSFKFIFFFKMVSLFYLCILTKKKLRKYDPFLGSLIKMRVWDYLEAKGY